MFILSKTEKELRLGGGSLLLDHLEALWQAHGLAPCVQLGDIPRVRVARVRPGSYHPATTGCDSQKGTRMSVGRV